MNTRPDPEMPEQPTKADVAIHEVQNVIDAMGCRAEKHIEADNYEAAKDALDMAWELQQATWQQSPHWAGCRPERIRDALLALGYQLNQTPTATKMREEFHATLDAEVASGEMTLRRREVFLQSSYAMPYSSAAKPKTKKHVPSENLKKELVAAANFNMRKARTEGKVAIRVKFGECILTYRNYGGRTGTYELVTDEPQPRVVERAGAGIMRQALIEI